MKRFLALFVSLLMITSQLSLPAVYADESDEIETVFAQEDVPAQAVPDVSYTALPSNTSIPKSGAYYLTGNVTLSGSSAQYLINGDLHLDLRGFTIYSKSSATAQGTIRNDSANNYTIEITDTVGGGCIDGTGQSQNAFVFTGGSSKTNVKISNVCFKNFTNSNANAGGVCVFQGNTTVLIDNCTFRDINKSAAHAGAIYNSTSSCTIKNSTFENITGTKSGETGGAVRNTKVLNIYNCSFINCKSIHGGALGNSGGGTLNVYGCTFTGNTTTGGNGGAIYITNGTLTIADYTDGETTVHTKFENNKPGTSSGLAGAVYYQSSAAVSSISGAIFAGNSSQKAGGAIRVDGGGLSLSNCTFTGNSATQGAAIYTAAGVPLNLKNTSVTGNVTSDSTGCAVICQGVTTVAGKTVIKDNLASNVDAAERKNLRMSASSGNNSVVIGTEGLDASAEIYLAPTAASLTVSGAASGDEAKVFTDKSGYEVYYDGGLLRFDAAPELTVDMTDVAVREGGEQEVTAIMLPAYLANRAVVWASEDESIATVTPGTDGKAVIKGISVGTTTVTVTSDYDAGISKTINVKVSESHIHNGHDYLPWDETASANYQTSLPGSGYYYLTCDVTLNAQQSITAAGSKLGICLNGYTIKSNYQSGGQGLIRCDKTNVVIEVDNCKNAGCVDGEGQSINGFIFAGSGSQVNVILNNITVKNFRNTSANSGAVICLQGTSKVTALNCVFEANGGCKNGGVIWQNSSSASEFTGCCFTDNCSTDAAGVAMISNASGSIAFDNCSFTGNKGLHGSVAAYGGGHGTFIFKDCSLTGNTDLGTAASVGAIYVNNSNKKLTLEGTNIIKDNFNSAQTPISANVCLQDANAVFTLKNPTADTDIYYNTIGSNKSIGSAIGTLAEGSLTGTYTLTPVKLDTDIVLSGSELIIKILLVEHDHSSGWVEWKSAGSLPTVSDADMAQSRKFFLSQDVTTSASAVLTGSEITLCLNGHNIYVGGTNCRMYRISDGGGISLMNCKESGIIQRCTEGRNAADGYINGGIIGAFKDNDSDAACSITLSGINFKGFGSGYDGQGGGAIYTNTGSLYIKDCCFDGFYCAGNGGAVSGLRLDSYTVKGGTAFTNNKADGSGGALRSEESNITISGDVSFKNNSAGTDGGAVFIFRTTGSSIDGAEFSGNTAKTAGALNIGRGKTTVTNCLFTDNKAVKIDGAGGQAGAVVVSGHDEVFGDGELIAKSCRFINNTADNSGGAIYLSQPTAGYIIASVEDSEFAGNVSAANGGAVYAGRNDNNTDRLGSVIFVSGSEFDGNSAENGGAIFCQGELTVNEGSYTNNKANTDGGAIYVTGIGMKFNMTGGTVKNNKSYKNPAVTSSSGRGGGIMLWGRGDGTDIGCISNVTVSGNYAENYAGGLYVGNGKLSLSGTHIDSNSAGENAAGIAVGGKADVSMSSGSVNNNKTKLASGIAIQKDGSFRFSGGSVSGNIATVSGGAGIYVVAGGELLMSGGTVSRNKANGGGGGISVNATEQDTYAGYISGGEISGNTSEGDGAGIYVSVADITINANIKDNTSASGAGGINVRGKGKATLTGGEISGNKARNGGGVVATTGGQIFLKGAKITKNEANPGGGGGIYVVGNETAVAKLHIESGEVSENYAFGNAGGINCGGVLTMSGGTIKGNNCGFYGGGLYLTGEYCKAVIDDGLITGNVSGADGGAILGRGKADIVMNGGTISSNQALTHGGGMLIQSYATFTMNGGIWDGNISGGTGGAIRTTDNVITLNGGTFSNNVTGGQGGAIYTGGTFTAKNIVFENNKVDGSSTQYESFGGAFNDNGGDAVFEGCTFTGNSSTGQGGALSSIYSSATVSCSSCSFSGNSAGNYGGAIAGYGATTVNINDCEIKENNSGYGGGAVSLRGGPTMNFTGTDIENNFSIQGGAFLVDMGNRLNLRDSAIEGNTASSDGGAIHSSGIILLDNTVISGNSSGALGAVVIDGTVNDPALQLILSKLSFKDDVRICDNTGGDLYNGKRSTMNVYNVNELGADALIYVNLEAGNISSNLIGSFDYELLGEKQYKITNGTRSLTDPEEYVSNDDPVQDEITPDTEDNDNADIWAAFPLAGKIGIIGGGAVLLGGIIWLVIILAGKKKKKN